MSIDYFMAGLVIGYGIVGISAMLAMLYWGILQDKEDMKMSKRAKFLGYRQDD